MSASRFHRDHAQHISISEKLSKELKKTGQDLLQQISNINQKMSDQLLVKVINGVVGDICGVIPNLQEIVIKSKARQENNADLLNELVKKLSQYCNEMVQENNSQSSTLADKFKIVIQNILLEAEGLLNIIKTDSLHDFKHELVENLKQIMYAIHTGQIRIQIENYNYQEIKNMVDDMQKQFFEDIATLENCSPDVLKSFIYHVMYSIKHCFQMSHKLNTMASNYSDVEIQRRLLDAANLLNVASTAALQIDQKVTNTKEAVQAITQYSTNGWKSVQEVFKLFDICKENEKNSENLKDIVKYIASYGMIINIHCGKGIKNDGLVYLLNK